MTFYRSIKSPSLILKGINEAGFTGDIVVCEVFREQNGALIATGARNRRYSRSDVIEIERVEKIVPFNQSKHDALKEDLFTRNGEKVLMLTTKARGPRPMKGYVGESSENLNGWPLHGRYSRDFGISSTHIEDRRDLFVAEKAWVDVVKKSENASGLEDPLGNKIIHVADVDAIINAIADRMVGMLRDALTGKLSK